MEHLYLAVPRDEHGYPTYLAKFGTMRSARELHDYACFLLGINESATVERL